MFFELRNFKKIFLLFIFFSSNSNATTLQEAVEVAVSNNKNIKYQEYKTKSTQTEKISAIAEFLPNVSASAQYGNKQNRISNGNNFSNKERVEELRLEQSVFNGFGSIAKYNSAKYNIQSAKSQENDKRQEIALMAAQAYCELYLAQENVKINEESEKISKKIIDLASGRKNSKIIDNSDFIKYSYEALEIKSAYLDSVNKMAAAKAEYENIVGAFDDKLIEPDIVDEKFVLDDVLNKALASNNQVQSAYYQYLSAKSQHSVEQSKFAPSVSVVASAAKQYNVVYLNQENLDTQSVYLNLSVPIFQKGTEYANVSKASHERSAAKENYEIAKDNLQKDVKTTFNEYELAMKMVEERRNLLDLAYQRFEIFQKRSDKNLVDKIEYFRVKIEYNKRFTEHLEAKIRALKAYYQIKYYLAEL